MKSVLRWCVVPLLATTLMAQTAAKPSTAKKSSAVTAQDVQALRDALAAQQQQIEQLRQQLQQRDQAWQQSLQQSQQQVQQAQTAATDAEQKAASVQGVADQNKDTVTKLASEMADVQTALTNNATGVQDEQKRTSALEGLVGRFRFNGDVRVRGESFFQGGCDPSCPDRTRARIRVRFGFDGKLNEDFIGGLSIATGTLGDPTTTNTTMTNFFDRHTIGLDRGYITYNPLAHRWVSVTGGKFAYTWNRTAQTFDSDLNPEGFSEKFSFDLTKTSYLKNVTFQLMQMMFNESSPGSDSYALGGQLSGRLKIGPLTTTPSFTLLKWNNPDAILQANAFSVQTSPGEGPGCQNPPGVVNPPNCVFAPNKMTNATYVVGGTNLAHFYSQFMYADFILNNQITTPWQRFPINLLLEYENNIDAKDHPLDSTGAVATNLGKQSHLYLVDVNMGQLKNKNDIQFGYAWLRQEQDSVLASFDESDQRAPTNVLQNRIYALWKMRSNVTAAYTFWFGHTLNSNLENAILIPGQAPGETQPDLKRMQFDLIYNF